ncbi:MAG: DUF1573 domain-containing protein [Bacteroidales bacterium]|nr:DUF1573 domain-containing protein [Bacteroidales bacterium]
MKLNLSVLLLLVAFSLSAQPKIAFDKTQHNFGKVNEGDGAASYDFTFKNSGTAPLIIQDVKTTCGCTTPEWTRQPILPGATGFIKVSYDVKGRPGAIDKMITVHSNSLSSPTSLRIIGEVIPVERHPSEAFRYTAGTIRLDDMHVAFNRMYSYEKPALVVTAYNPGPDIVKIAFIDLPAYIKTEVTPATIKKGEKATIKLTYDAARKNDWGFVSDRISMILNDNKAKDYKLTVTATIEEDFSRWTAAQLQNAPAVSLDRQVIEAGKIKKGEKKAYQVKLTNNGKSKLSIRKVESGSPLVTVDAPKEINAGASAGMTITYDSAGQSGEQSKAITLITNDPKNAQIILRLKADVTE